MEATASSETCQNTRRHILDYWCIILLSTAENLLPNYSASYLKDTDAACIFERLDSLYQTTLRYSWEYRGSRVFRNIGSVYQIAEQQTAENRGKAPYEMFITLYNWTRRHIPQYKRNRTHRNVGTLWLCLTGEYEAKRFFLNVYTIYTSSYPTIRPQQAPPKRRYTVSYWRIWRQEVLSKRLYPLSDYKRHSENVSALKEATHRNIPEDVDNRFGRNVGTVYHPARRNIPEDSSICLNWWSRCGNLLPSHKAVTPTPPSRTRLRTGGHA
jgi:hypothetical protein